MMPLVALLGLPPWHWPLSLDGGGYWRRRVVVEVRNPSDRKAEGETVTLTVGRELPIAGERAESLRVCDEMGRELLFDVRSPSGMRKEAGTLSPGDRVSFPATVPPKGRALLFLYLGNPRAWAVADFLKPGLVNGSFESGEADPEGWGRWGEDPEHRLVWVEGVARTGRRSVMTEVSPGAAPTWVKFYQRDIPLRPGARYRFEGWVRAESVKGKAGWFVHIFGERGEWLANKVFNAGGGTYDWRRVAWEFTAPEGARLATVGTVLYGTGRAWFDDASLVPLDRVPLRARVVADERLDLRQEGGPERRPKGDWRLRATVLVRNLSSEPMRRAPVVLDLRRAVWRLSKWKGRLGFLMLDPKTGRACPQMRLGEDFLLFLADLPGRSEKRFDLFISPTEKGLGEMRYPDLLRSPANLVRNPSFEEGGKLPTGWRGPEVARPRRVPEGRVGTFCARLDIPKEARGSWVGWHQEVPVRPLKTYLYCGFVKVEGTEGTVRLHGHWHDREHKLTKAQPFFSTSPAVKAGEGWVLTSALVGSPADAAFVEFHLTSNVAGTVWHDGIFFGEVALGAIERVEPVAGGRPRRPLGALSVWEVNPLVKVFPDDLPLGGPLREVEVRCAKGEWEPVQLALRASRGLEGVRVSAGELKGPAGASLPAPELWWVGYVKVDHPSAYYSTALPRRFRFVPRGFGRSDGWAGEWPDPLFPMRPLDLEPGRTRAALLLVHVPEGARPGVYRGRVKVEAEGRPMAEIPLKVRVWPFSLPRRSGLKVIFDLRNGPGWNVMPDEGALERWYRLYAKYRISPGWIRPAPKVRYEGGRIRIEAEEFDRMARLCLDELGVNVFYMPFFYAFGWAYRPRRFFGLEPFTPEYERAYKAGLRALAEHLRSRGWLDKCVYYISDEPHYRHKFVVEQMRRLCRLAHEAIPGVPIYSSTWVFVPEWEGYLDIWGVGPHGSCPVETMERLRREGYELWFTTDGHMCIDTPYLAIERLLPWLCFKYGVSGYEFWGLSWWTYDPWERGWHRYIRSSPEGKTWRWVRYPNGDGYLTYPGERVGHRGPLPSIRLVQVREGIEDWHLLVMLERAARRAKEMGLDTSRAERALERARSLVQIPNRGGLRSTDLMPDPGAVLQVRAEVGEALSELAARLGGTP